MHSHQEAGDTTERNSDALPELIPPQEPLVRPDDTEPGDQTSMGTCLPAVAPVALTSSTKHKPDLPNPDVSYLWNVHTYINEYIRFSDTKAGVIIVFSSALIGSLYAAKLHVAFVSAAMNAWNTGAWVSASAFLLLALSVVFSAWSIVPRLWNDQPRGFIFWQSILAHGDAQSYRCSFQGASSFELVEHLSGHIFTLSRVCDSKYRLVTLGMWCVLIGGLLAGILLLLRSTP